MSASDDDGVGCDFNWIIRTLRSELNLSREQTHSIKRLYCVTNHMSSRTWRRIHLAWL